MWTVWWSALGWAHWVTVPGGTVVVTAIATETGGDGGVDETVFCECNAKQNKTHKNHYTTLAFWFSSIFFSLYLSL